MTAAAMTVSDLLGLLDSVPGDAVVGFTFGEGFVAATDATLNSAVNPPQFVLTLDSPSPSQEEE